MLLCIEMAIFAVFHLWAFPWTVYDVRRSEIVAAESAAGYIHDPKTAYQGGKFGERALMDAFNPWDLIKAVGRGFRWAAIGRKNRHNDISYQNPQSKGLEPTRNQFTAFGAGAGSGAGADESTAYRSTTTTSGPNNAYYYDDDHDGNRLLQHAQANPTSDPNNTNTYPRPMSTSLPRKLALSPSHSPKNSISQPSAPPRSRSPYMERSPYMDNTGHLAPTTANSSMGGHVATDDQGRKTSGESSHRRTPTSGLPPDETPLGPPGRKSSEHAEWERWGGRGEGEDERALGGGHGIGDNRF